MNWEACYNLVKIYYEYYGNLNIPKNFKTHDGINFDKNGINIGNWILAQRSYYINGILNEESVSKLKVLDNNFEKINDMKWLFMYDLTQAYYEHYEKLNIPKNFKTKNGYIYDENGFELGNWLFRQKYNYRKNNLDEYKIKLLNQFNIKYDRFCMRLSWDEWYSLVKNYYNHYGSLNFKLSFKTFDGINFDENGYALGYWVYGQIEKYQNNKLSDDKIELLTKININSFNFKGAFSWEDWYNLAKEYYKHHDNLLVPLKFRTNNGYSCSPDGYDLGDWLNKQRTYYKKNSLSDDKIELLEKISIVWNIRLNKHYNKKLLLEVNAGNNIEYSKCKYIIDKLPYNELYAKIKYLKSNNIPIITNNELHEIFFMSSLNMQAKYNISKEELVTNYGDKITKLYSKKMK